MRAEREGRKVLEEALVRARAAGARTAEAALLGVRGHSVEFTDRGLETYRGSAVRGIGLRVARGRRLGFSYGQDLSPGGLARLAERAVAAASLADLPAFPFADAPVLPADLGILDEAGLAAPFEDDRERLAAVVRDAAAGHPAFRRVKQVTLRSARTDVAIRSTSGADAAYARSSFTLAAGVVAERGGSSELGWESETATRRELLPWEQIGSAAAVKAGERLGAGRAPGGRQPVVLDREVAAELLALLGSAFSADAVRKGKAVCAGSRGERRLARAVTVVDDPAEPGTPGSCPCDDEGQPALRTTLVEAGVVRGWLHSLETAHATGEPPTGNGFRRSYEALPAPRPANLRLEPGRALPDAWVRAAGRLLLVDEIIGAHTMNAVSGDFSVGAAGFVCEPGLRRPFRGATIAGNIVGLFAGVEEVGADLRRFGAVAAPSLLVGGIDVAG